MELMRRLALALVMLGGLGAASASAQPGTPSASASASLTSTTCTGTPGSGTGCLTLNTSGYASAVIQITGTWSGTQTFQSSLDGVNYQTINATPVNGSSQVTTTTSNGVWALSVAGIKYLQVATTVFTSGTAVVTMQTALAGGGSGGGGGGGSSVTINDPSVTSQKAAVNASGQLSITCANCSGSGASAVDNSAFTAGTTSGAPAMGFFHSTIDTVTDGRTATLAMDSKRNLFNVIRDAAGNARGVNVSAGNALIVDASATTQPVSGTVTTTPPANASTNVAQFGGVNVSTGTGASGTGIPRVTISNDSSLAANQSVNVAQVNGVTTLTGVGAAGTGTQRVVDVASGTTGSAPPTQASYVGGLQSGATAGLLGGITVCDTPKAISVTSATTQLLITGVASRQVYICAIDMVTAIANNVALISGTGATCGTGTTGIAGGTTAANGYNFAANGGLTKGSGLGWVMRSTAAGDSICVVTSAAGPLAGSISYAIY